LMMKRRIAVGALWCAPLLRGRKHSRAADPPVPPTYQAQWGNYKRWFGIGPRAAQAAADCRSARDKDARPSPAGPSPEADLFRRARRVCAQPATKARTKRQEKKTASLAVRHRTNGRRASTVQAANRSLAGQAELIPRKTGLAGRRESTRPLPPRPPTTRAPAQAGT